MQLAQINGCDHAEVCFGNNACVRIQNNVARKLRDPKRAPAAGLHDPKTQATGPPRQATGPHRSGARVGVGMLRGAKQMSSRTWPHGKGP